MFYIKFNCQYLADINAVNWKTHRNIQILSEKTNDIIDSLDPQILKYDWIKNQLTNTSATMNSIDANCYSAFSTLDYIIDIYCKAESKVLETVQKLPICGNMSADNRTVNGSGAAGTAAAMGAPDGVTARETAAMGASDGAAALGAAAVGAPDGATAQGAAAIVGAAEATGAIDSAGAVRATETVDTAESARVAEAADTAESARAADMVRVAETVNTAESDRAAEEVETAEAVGVLGATAIAGVLRETEAMGGIAETVAETLTPPANLRQFWEEFISSNSLFIPTPVLTSHINNSDLIAENWLFELIIRSRSNDR